MERDFTNENFERFLRKSSDGLRMHPSDKVWAGISKKINQRRRRFGVILGASLLAISTSGYFFITHSIDEKKLASSEAPVNLGSKKISNKAISQTPVTLNPTNFSDPAVPSLAIVRRLAVATQTSKGLSGATNAVEQQASTGFSNAGNDIASNDFTSTIIDDSYPLQSNQAKQQVNIYRQQPADPQTIESILNSFQYKQRRKVGMQIYFTPTVSYRSLRREKGIEASNINDKVTHKPAFGFALGAAWRYPITDLVTLRAGAQFNVNRYDIKTYNSSTELATITLSQGSRTYALNTATTYNNVSGYKSNWLENFYFQVSLPLGAELQLGGNDKVKFGAASTIQPTYLIGDNTHLLSTDYKNYAEVPSLIRRWNVNTSVETFVSYSTGHLQWQVGPQVRYQMLSSFKKKYPVKENLFDFGLRVGISLKH